MTNLKFKKMKNIIKYVQSECEILEIILFDLQLLSYLMLNLDSSFIYKYQVYTTYWVKTTSICEGSEDILEITIL